MVEQREHWATKLGLILAMAGNAVGLGNFIRFPAKAAAYGGGAYLIPYFIALVLLGIPIMFVEWVLGRYGGQFGHGHLAPMLYLTAKKKLSPSSAAWFAIIGGAIAFIAGVMITGYYSNIVGWMAFYACSSLGGVFAEFETAGDAIGYLVDFLTNPVYNFPAWLISLFIMTFIVSRGIRRGIEIAAKIMMPILFLEGIVLIVLSLTLGAPVKPEWSSIKGFEWLWTPKLTKLGDPTAFIEGAGQIFFTLSIGIAGIIPNYASYLRREDDIPLSALTTTSLNEFAEVVMGASIAIPLAYAFGGYVMPSQEAINAWLAENPGASLCDALDALGASPLVQVEHGCLSGFMLSVSALPPLFGKLGGLGSLAGFLWYSLLWFAGTTSAIAIINVITTIFEEDFNIKRSVSAWISFTLVFLAGVFVNIEGAMNTPQLTDYLDLADFYAGSLILVVVALIEVVAVLWLWGVEESYEELHRGAFLTIPKWYWRIVAGVITPIYLIIMLVWFAVTGTSTPPAIPENMFGWLAVVMMFVMFVVGLVINKVVIYRRYGKEIRGGT